MSIPLYLLRYPSNTLFNDHWALFLLSHTSPNHRVGIIFQVEGDPLNGFVQDIQQECDFTQEHCGRKPPQCIELGILEVGDGTIGTDPEDDSQVRELVEYILREVPPPGKTLRTAAADKAERQGRVEIRDCQYWVGVVVRFLVSKMLLPPEASTIIDKVPGRCSGAIDLQTLH
jgi:hypothetical protein